MRPAFLYLVQAWTADPYRQAEHDRLARAASRTCHTRTPRRRHRVRGLPAVVARRTLTLPPGRRQPMTEPVTAQTCGREPGCCRPKTTRPMA